MRKNVTIWSVLLLSGAVESQELEVERAPEVQTYLMVGRESVRGEVLGIEADRVRMRIYFDKGTMQRTFPLDRFRPGSVFRMRLALTADDDVAGHLDLVRYALDTDQVSQARQSLARARSIAGDPNLGQDLEREFAAAEVETLERRFFEQLNDDRLIAAEKTLASMRRKYAEALAPGRLEGLLREVDRERGRRTAESAAVAAAEDRKQVAIERERRLSPLMDRLEVAARARQKGLLNSSQFSRAIDDFGRAVRQCEVVLRTLDQLERRYGNDEITMREAGLLRREATQVMVDSLIHSASMYLTRSSLTAAMGSVNKVFVVDPRNEQALELRARIETAASYWGWGWGWRRG